MKNKTAISINFLKLRRRIVLLSGLSMLCFQAANAQSILTRLAASATNGTVSIDWVIGIGNTCNGVVILHSIDSVNFSPVGEIKGVCGSSSYAVSYNFQHTNPIKNRTNYYRLALGGTGFSDLISVVVIEVNAGYLLFQNPVSNVATIYFSNENKKQYFLSVYNLNGSLISTFQSTESYFQFPVNDFLNGQYLFSIALLNATPDSKGKFIVQH